MKKLLLFLFLTPLFLAGCASDYQTPPAVTPLVSTTTVATTTKSVKPVATKKISEVATKTPKLITTTTAVSKEPVLTPPDKAPDVSEVIPVTPEPVVAPVRQEPAPVQVVSPAPELSNDNYYTNSAGDEVHSPAYAPSIPAGATAICGDGTYSFSRSRRGTCSHHGDVGEWLN